MFHLNLLCKNAAMSLIIFSISVDDSWTDMSNLTSTYRNYASFFLYLFKGIYLYVWMVVFEVVELVTLRGMLLLHNYHQ